MKIRLLALAVAALAVTGACTPDEERHKATCLQRGFNQDSPEFRDCVTNEYRRSLELATRKHSKK